MVIHPMVKKAWINQIRHQPNWGVNVCSAKQHSPHVFAPATQRICMLNSDVNLALCLASSGLEYVYAFAGIVTILRAFLITLASHSQTETHNERIVRQSKFRHVFCKPVKHESCMSEIKITEITWDSLFCDVNPKFIAIINKGSGGPFLVIPVNKVGRIDKDYPFVDAHKAPCLEVRFSPFNDNVIASCSEDTTTKVWLIPDKGLIKNLTDPVVELCGHQKRVNTLAWHPTANNILLTAGGENKLLMWNVGTGEALLEIAGHPDQIWSIAFNYDGSQFVTTCKDRMIRIIDSHTGDVVHEGMGHEGVKPQRAIFTQDGRIISTGFSKRSERHYALRPAENLSEPIMQDELDTSNAVLVPLYDEDSGLLYMAGKGDCAIRYYEINNDYPFVHYVSDVSLIIYKVTTKGVVDILQFFVPRKSDLWQADLYPDTRSTMPALSAEEFIEGKNAPPKLMPVNPGAAQAKPKIQVAKKANILAQMQPTAQEPAQSREPPPSRAAEPPRAVQQPGPMQSRRQADDEDLGIVRPDRASARQERPRRDPTPPEAPNPMIPKQQVNLRSRGERDVGSLTPGQQRAARELDRIKREQGRTAEDDVPPPSTTSSRRHSTQSTASTVGGAGQMPAEMGSAEEMFNDIQKMKAILRQHERRIRLLEEQLADANMASAYGI
ncbi:type of WD40 repeat domain-containing protein [Ditylenchus destructor]|uniref:Coronin n=1 Tax=Ditylenchus destructor TaxID=166010 RepID=A0AAD4MZU2_9BILA|nr:type of WD40 repeat domain-containing protein [Ditylenchus destructor]